MTERIGWGGQGGGKIHVGKDKAGQTTSQDRRDEPIVTKEQRDKSNDDVAGEGEGQSKRKRKGESAEFSFGAEKESRAKLDADDSSLIRVIKFYWKSQAPAVLTKKFVIKYQELLFKQNAPRGKLKIPWTVKTPQGIFIEEHGAVGGKKKCLLPMTAPFLSIDSKPSALFDTTRMRTPVNHTSLSTDTETLHSEGWNQVRGVRSRSQQKIIPCTSQHQRASNRKSEYMGKTQAKEGISLQQACSTIINETRRRLARVMQHAWGNVAYIETQQIHSLRWVGQLVRGRWRFKPLTTCAVGVRREGVALTPGKSKGGRSKEPKMGSKDRYKRKREKGAKGKQSMDHEGNRGGGE